jgi:hypothetical protein
MGLGVGSLMGLNAEPAEDFEVSRRRDEVHASPDQKGGRRG